MKIVSWNVNGIRANEKHGFLRNFKNINADIFCLQEIKAFPEQFPDEIKKIKPYFFYSNSATKPGYSGVAVYSKKRPLSVEKEIGIERFDSEGRYLRLNFADFILIVLYLPHGGRQKENLIYKLDVYKKIIALSKTLKNKKTILIGDFNIAHQEIDLERPRQNKKNIMFTPEERKQLDNLVAIGFVDTFRQFNGESGNYTWWPYMANARERNLGWRIDYCFVSECIAKNIEKSFINKEVMGSDHCPVGIEIVLD